MRLMKLIVVLLLALGFTWPVQALAGEYDKFLDAVAAGRHDDLIGYKSVPVYPKYSYDITAHSNCVLENSKNVQQTPIQANRVSAACRHKATPKKCRNVSAMPPNNESKSPQEICGEACASAGLWSRKYGECSLD
ncbi:MAG: hypothetical protein Q7T21_15815 [Gallionella sp.]|nr:hypothetical protein [Gallionella sp.]